MARRGERKARTRASAPAPKPQPSKIGVRVWVEEYRGRSKTHSIDPSVYQCRLLVGQLADEWLKITRASSLSGGGTGYSTAVRLFATFADQYLAGLGLNPEDARLDGQSIDLVEVIYQWEGALRQKYGLQSKQPYNHVRSLLTLIGQRAGADPKVPGNLRKRAQAPASYRPGRGRPLDEFSNAERIALRDAARAAVRKTEDRLVRGRELLGAGTDPALGGWRDLPNLLWVTRTGLLNSQVLTDNLPKNPRWWPLEVRELLPEWTGEGQRPGIRALGRALGRMLFPDELDLQAFRVLLLLGMTDITPEELHDLHLSDMEFTDGGLRLVQQKKRAMRIRADLHRETETLPEGKSDDSKGPFFAGGGAWDVPGLMRRLLAATELTRDAFDGEPWLFLAVERRYEDGRLEANLARFNGRERRFTHWIADQRDGQGRPLEISQPHDVRRLRKTTKVTRAVALGGTVTDLAGDDHHVEVYRGHYAQGTTAHIMAGRAVNRAQSWVFQRTLAAPVLVDEDAESRLEEPHVAEDLGLNPGQAAAMRAGELDMGLVNCRDPYDSPHTPGNKLCHVAPAMCMLCRNAVIFTSQLPRLLLLADHIERMRAALPPPRWQAVWGAQAGALKEVFAECADRLPAARQEITELGVRLDLPLGQRTEYGR
ncbi:hypothetical protein GCM10027073_74340 [Streptomyces chlorus]|uniref:Integrase n=1 Tax=Streptomyces chlorus TaxID=887452 RepID=A0ABW1E8J7_9ACTN